VEDASKNALFRVCFAIAAFIRVRAAAPSFFCLCLLLFIPFLEELAQIHIFAPLKKEDWETRRLKNGNLSLSQKHYRQRTPLDLGAGFR